MVLQRTVPTLEWSWMMKISKTRTIMIIVMSMINHFFSYDKHSLPFPLMLVIINSRRKSDEAVERSGAVFEMATYEQHSGNANRR